MSTASVGVRASKSSVPLPPGVPDGTIALDISPLYWEMTVLNPDIISVTFNGQYPNTGWEGILNGSSSSNIGFQLKAIGEWYKTFSQSSFYISFYIGGPQPGSTRNYYAGGVSLGRPLGTSISSKSVEESNPGFTATIEQRLPEDNPLTNFGADSGTANPIEIQLTGASRAPSYSTRIIGIDFIGYMP